MNVSLRDVCESDLPILFEHQRDPEATRMAAFTSRDEEAFLAHWHEKILGDPAVLKKAVVIDGKVAGNIVSFERDGHREIGYWIGREYWGRGVATEALSRFLRLETGRPLRAVVAAHNAASIRVLRKCGFEISGRQRGSAGGRGPVVEELTMTLHPGDGPGGDR